MRHPVGRVYRRYYPNARTAQRWGPLRGTPELVSLLRIAGITPRGALQIEEHRRDGRWVEWTNRPECLDGMDLREVDETEWLIARLAGAWIPGDDPYDATVGCPTTR